MCAEIWDLHAQMRNHPLMTDKRRELGTQEGGHLGGNHGSWEPGGCQSHLGSRGACKHKETQGQTHAPIMIFLPPPPSPKNLKGPCQEVSLLVKTDGNHNSAHNQVRQLTKEGIRFSALGWNGLNAVWQLGNLAATLPFEG